MANQKHLVLSDRIKIEIGLKESLSFKAIAKDLNKDCTTISKEIRSHFFIRKTGARRNPFNDCLVRINCGVRHLCNPCTKQGHGNRPCGFCLKCSSLCQFYIKETCNRLKNPPYVCNGCENLTKCTLEKAFYSAEYAQNEYEIFRSESRSGISITESEAIKLDKFISPLILKGQSIHHICSSNPDVIMYSEKTIYNYVDYNIFSARNIDLPRKVRYRPRKSVSNYKVDKKCRCNRTYDDFLAFLKGSPDIPVVEIDSILGVKGGKVLLTIHFTKSELMLAFLRDSNDSRSVLDIFDKLYLELGHDIFMKLFPLILTDNGSEFSNPSAIEYDSYGNLRTRIFYCDPSAPYQKGAAENNHELIRRVVPKRNSFDSFCQDDINLMMNHINSYNRKKLNNRTPHDVFSFFYGPDVVNKLGLELIPPNDVVLQPSLLKK